MDTANTNRARPMQRRHWFTILTALLLLALLITALPPAAPPALLPLVRPAQAQEETGLNAELFQQVWTGDDDAYHSSLATGDYDSDGDLDLAIGRNGVLPLESELEAVAVVLYANKNGHPDDEPIWREAEDGTFRTSALAWGDVDNDGDLDLLVGTVGVGNRLYRNNNGALTTTPVWTSTEEDDTRSVAWGDVNGDGWLDLAVGNGCDLDSADTTACAQPNRVYLNQNGTLETTASWQSNAALSTQSVAWGDVNGDGLLDLAVGNGGSNQDNHAAPNHIHLNQGGALNTAASWVAAISDNTTSVAWADMNNDNQLDLIVGNNDTNQTDLIYQFTLAGGNIASAATIWQGEATPRTEAVLPADYNSDGQTDLAIVTAGGEPNSVYTFEVGTDRLTDTVTWRSRTPESTSGAAWADMDNDGDIDLLTADLASTVPVRLYTNSSSYFHDTSAFSLATSDANQIRTAAWGDYDNDGDLDLVVGRSAGQPVRIYPNNNGTIATTPAWASTEQTTIGSIAWGDINRDGWLDLATGGSDAADQQPTRIYYNDGSGTLETTASWPPIGQTSLTLDELVWVDADDDGDIDLSGITNERAAVIYRNENGTLTDKPVWRSDADNNGMVESNLTAIAWGDMDGDGRLDLALGRYNGYSQVYGFRTGPGGSLESKLLWQAPDRYSTKSIAWGDVSRDGMLDLALAGDDGIFIYGNTAGVLGTEPVWEGDEDFVSSVAWYDLGGDGDLDLATSNGIFLNDSGRLASKAVSIPGNFADNLLLADIDSDGDLDILTLQYLFEDSSGIQVYLNRRDNRSKATAPPAVTLTWKGIPDNNANGRAFAYPADPWQAGDSTEISFNLFHPASIPAQAVHGFYSLDGGGTWLRALRLQDSTTNVLTGPLASRPYGTVEAANTHTFTWDTWSSGFFGQSNDVLFRLLVVPGITTQANGMAGPYHYGGFGASTLPVRVDGNPIIVTDDGSAAEDAFVYRLPEGDLQAVPLSSDAGNPLRTDPRGKLRGTSSLNLSDQIIALYPISSTESYTYYLTSARPTSETLEGSAVGDRILQELEVSYPLLVFDLDVSLEWDASSDEQYLEQLTDDLSSASAALYDWTDGQAALGTITVYQNRERWSEADIRIYASNRLRPNADQGGIATAQVAETVVIDGEETRVTYNPGQIRMGYTWNRYGNAEGVIGEDWPRALAHEIGHYALYLNDNYLALESSTGAIEYNTTCKGAMFDPYLNNNSEFYPSTGWAENCSETLSEQQTGRSDWETILHFYNQTALDFTLTEPAAFDGNTGPTSLSLLITSIVINNPTTSNDSLGTPTISMVDTNGQPFSPDRSTRALLYQGNRLLDLGRATGDQITVLGAREGNELCVYDLVSEPPLLGCEALTKSSDQITLLAVSTSQNWPPNVVLDFPDATTVQIQVTDPPTDASLMAQVFPIDAEASAAITLENGAGTVSLSSAAESGYVRVWVDETATDSTPRRETITDYRLQGDLSTTISLAAHDATSNPDLSQGGGGRNPSKAPVYSSDGQATLYGLNLEFLSGEFYALQSTNTPTPPAWASPVGRAYRLTATSQAPQLAGNVGIALGYLENEVIDGHEAWLKVYYWDDTASSTPTWQVLPSTTDFERNLISAPTQGPGHYVLMSSFEVTLAGAGWNHFGYPIRGTPRPVAEALASITGAFDSVWHYNTATPSWEAWTTFNASAPDWVSDLETLEFGEGYWISMTRVLDRPLYLEGPPDPEDEATSSSQLAETSSFVSNAPNVPALYYAVLEESSQLTPTAGMQVQARVDGTLCGASETQAVDNEIVFRVKVVADAPGGIAGCGAEGRLITIELDGQPFARVRWKNDRATELLNISANPVYLPLLLR